MPSLMVIIFAVEVAVELVNSIGASTINRAAWMGLNALPTKLSLDFAEQRKLQQEYLKVRQEMNATSSQDQFAKWAKLKRQHDKLLDQLEKKKTVLDATKATFDRYVTAVRWLATRGLQFFLPFWYAKVPMFWLPHGFFPYYAEWLISFPRAPLGSVSIVSWQLACTGFMVLLRDTLTAAFSLLFLSSSSKSGGGQPQQKQQQQKKQAQPVQAAAAAGATGEKGEKPAAAAAASGKEEKKDL